MKDCECETERWKRTGMGGQTVDPGYEGFGDLKYVDTF